MSNPMTAAEKAAMLRGDKPVKETTAGAKPAPKVKPVEPVKSEGKEDA